MTRKPGSRLPIIGGSRKTAKVGLMLSRDDGLGDLIRLGGHQCLGLSPDALSSTDIDLCVVDSKTLLDNIDALQGLRCHGEADSCPILLVAEEAELEQVRAYLGSPVEDVICKPVHGIELAARVDSLVRLGRISGALNSGLTARDSATTFAGTRDEPINNRLHHAVHSQQFSLVFQPLVELESTRIVGAEALIRWPQADGTSIAPADFIPVAEKSGLIRQIGNWVLVEALAALQRWRDKGFVDLQIAVNMAVPELGQAGLVKQISGLLKALAIPPQCLKVELTESTLMSDLERMKRVVWEFRDAGVEVAIDDFGTGYSSLARLKSLPVHMLKIDRSFLFDTPEDQSTVMVINTIVQMAERLEIQALAEGVETEAQWRMLKGMGCPFGQGLFFCRPLTESDLLKRLHSQNTGT